MSPNDADGMANSVDPDQTASALFAQVYLSENLGSLRYASCCLRSFKCACAVIHWAKIYGITVCILGF